MSDSGQPASRSFLTTAIPLATYFLLKSMGWFLAGTLSAFLLLVLLCYFLAQEFKWVDLTLLAFFLFMLICVCWLKIEWISAYRNVFAPLMLAILAWGSVLLGKPFTEQYGRERMPPAWWDNPHFLRVNRILAWVWGGVFATGSLLAFFTTRSATLPYWMGLGISATLSLSAGIFTVWFPKWYRETIYLPQAGPNPLPE